MAERNIQDINVDGNIFTNITIVLNGIYTHIFVNGMNQISTDLVNRQIPGDNRVIAAFFVGDQPLGSSSYYRNLVIWDYDE